MPNKVYLLTGSNVGDSSALLKEAKLAIQKQVGEIEAASQLYKTAPWGNTNQQDFLNQVLAVNTILSATDVLKIILNIELQMGRTREKKWAPRTIDIDILFFNNEFIQEENLIVPHPLLHQRRFTLVPLAEIAPNYSHPLLHQSIFNLLQHCNDDSVVEKL
jgi:2-amino-4-hydroxy-6-hydroxymethyldihydropteridine diphosphokinase